MSMSDHSLPSNHTFLQYDDPEVMGAEEPDPPQEKTQEELKDSLFHTADKRFIPDPRLVEQESDYKKCQSKEAPVTKDTMDFLENMFPPKYWTDKGVRYKQLVSTTQADRPVMMKIHQKLDEEIERRQAWRVPTTAPIYCPIRFELHMELFDELIRQVSIDSKYRGYLLTRVRGELGETLDAYKNLLQISLAENTRTQSQIKTVDLDSVDPEIVLLRAKLSDLEGELAALQQEKQTFTRIYKGVCDKMELLDNIKTQLHEPELDFTRKIQHALERQIYHFEHPPSFEEQELEEVIHF